MTKTRRFPDRRRLVPIGPDWKRSFRVIGTGCGRWLLLLCALVLSACSTLERLDTAPPDKVTRTVALGTPNARFYLDGALDALLEEGLAASRREQRTAGVASARELGPAHLLAISGGGDDGAFGAGLLVGWSEAGTRPEFKLVTGVSTGALIAPFAFLGPAYDEQLTRVYTQISAHDVYESRPLFRVFFLDALRDTTPLYGLISRYVDEDMLAAIAREYAKGRLLFIGTTNLDARRPVIWNIGAIAASGHPQALTVVRKILLASSAIPGVFPPVMIDVVSDGERYQEMHVDGGAIAQVFLYPSSLGHAVRSAGGRTRLAYIIRNARLGMDAEHVERRFVNVAGRAISTMIAMSGRNDLIRIYFTTQRDGVAFNLVSIGDDFDAPAHEEDFDPAYMNALFRYGRDKGRGGIEWQRVPPGVGDAPR